MKLLLSFFAAVVISLPALAEVRGVMANEYGVIDKPSNFFLTNGPAIHSAVGSRYLARDTGTTNWVRAEVARGQTNAPTPVNPLDVANKAYVDSVVGGGSGAPTTNADDLVVGTVTRPVSSTGLLAGASVIASNLLTAGSIQSPGHSNYLGIAHGIDFIGGGSGLTSLQGTNIADGTIGSNKLDVATRALLGSGTSVPSGVLSNNYPLPVVLEAGLMVRNAATTISNGLNVFGTFMLNGEVFSGAGGGGVSEAAVLDIVDTNNHASLTVGGVTKTAWPLESRLQVYPYVEQVPVSSNAPMKLRSVLVVSNQFYNTFPGGVYNPQTRSLQTYFLQMTQHAATYAPILRSLSADGGQTFAPPSTNLSAGGTSDIGYAYFAPIRLPDGRLFASVAWKTNGTAYFGGYSISTNDGAYWPEPTPFPRPIATYSYELSAPPILLQNGTLLAQGHTFTNGAAVTIAGAWESADYGASWSWRAWKTNFSEVGLVQKFDGRLIGMFRGENAEDNKVYRGVSYDGGVTWASFTDVTPAASDDQPPAAFIAIGNKMLLATRDSTQRMGIWQSHDEGLTWTRCGIQYETDASFQMAQWVELGGGKVALFRSQATDFSNGPAQVYCDIYDLSVPEHSEPATTTPYAAYLSRSLAGKASVDKWVDLGSLGESLTNSAPYAPPMVGTDGNAWFNGTTNALLAQSTNWAFFHNGKPWTILFRDYAYRNGTTVDVMFDTCGGSPSSYGITIGRMTTAYGMRMYLQVANGSGTLAYDGYSTGTYPGWAHWPTNQWVTHAIAFDGEKWKFYADGARWQTVFTNDVSPTAFSTAAPTLAPRICALGSPLSYYGQFGLSDLVVWTNDIGDDAIARWTASLQANRNRSVAPTAWRTAVEVESNQPSTVLSLTGVGDETATIQAAINRGGAVILPAGTFYLTSLSMTNGSILQGAGNQTRLFFSSSPAISYNTNSANWADSVSPSGYGRFQVRDLSMVRSGAVAGVGVSFSAANGSVASGVTYSNFQVGLGFISAPGKGSYFNAAYNCTWAYCSTAMVFTADGGQSANRNNVSAARIYGANCGIYLDDSAQGNSFDGVDIEFMTGSGAKGIMCKGANNTFRSIWAESQVPTGETYTGMHLLNGFNHVETSIFPDVAGDEGSWYGLNNGYPYNDIANVVETTLGVTSYPNTKESLTVANTLTVTGPSHVGTLTTTNAVYAGNNNTWWVSPTNALALGTELCPPRYRFAFTNNVSITNFTGATNGNWWFAFIRGSNSSGTALTVSLPTGTEFHGAATNVFTVRSNATVEIGIKVITSAPPVIAVSASVSNVP